MQAAMYISELAHIQQTAAPEPPNAPKHNPDSGWRGENMQLAEALAPATETGARPKIHTLAGGGGGNSQP